MCIKERLNSGKHGVQVSAGEIKRTLWSASPQQIQAVTSHSKTTPLGTTKRTSATVALVWYNQTQGKKKDILKVFLHYIFWQE